MDQVLQVNLQLVNNYILLKCIFDLYNFNADCIFLYARKKI